MTFPKPISRWALSKQCFALLFSLLIFPVRASFALDYVIKEVIEVGEADFVPFLSPVIWSPDGTKIAFTKGGVIKISDTLGNVQEIIKTEMPIHRWDWVSDSQIAFYMRKSTEQGVNSIKRLSTIDVTLKIEVPLHNFNTFFGYREVEGYSTYAGPFKSVEGNSYYTQTQYSSSRGNQIFIARSFDESRTTTIENDHFLRWSDSGLYKVRVDQTDSTWLANKPFLQMGPRPVASMDFTYAVDGGQLFRLTDSTLVSIDTLLYPYPAKTIECGIVWNSFNPVASELAFTITCDDGENYIVNRIATLDCETLELTVIDSLIGISNCAAPSFSPDGRRIAFMANQKAYILTREIQG